MASWLVRCTPDQAFRDRTLAGDILLHCSVRHLTLTVPLSTQVYIWVPATYYAGGNPAMDYYPILRGSRNTLVASCCRDWVELQPGGPPRPVCRHNLYFTFYKRSEQLCKRKYSHKKISVWDTNMAAVSWFLAH